MPINSPLFVLGSDPALFPDPELALTEPNGLLAIGGDLEPQRLLAAYKHGIFPWYDKEPILWWSPNPRAVLFLDKIKLSKSLKKVLQKSEFEVKMDCNFAGVIEACAAPRTQAGQAPGTWITAEIQAAYKNLFELGYAHSIETYHREKLVGGLYGVSIGQNFFGESMFSLENNASKIALFYLAMQLKMWGFEFIDCQVWSEHLASLGATLILAHFFCKKSPPIISLKAKLENGHWCPT